MNIRFIKDKVPQGYVYPCSVKEIKEVIAKLPPEHLEGLKRIRLSYQKDANADASYIDGTITIYAIPHDFKQIFSIRPPDAVIKEHSRFGAIWRKIGMSWYCYWQHGLYKDYILKHVLLHELGHHMDEYHMRRGQEGREKFAEKYALQMGSRIYKNDGK